MSEAAQPIEPRPWLGVAMDPDEPGQGVRIGHVIRGSPAEKAGLREGDRILRVAADRVLRGQDVVHAVSSYPVGAAVDIAYLRAGKEQSAHAVLAAMPPQDDIVRMDLVGTFAPTWKDVESVSGSFPSSIAATRIPAWLCQNQLSFIVTVG